MSSFILEIAAFSLSGAVNAASAGANRIEFCENPSNGGTTPSFGSLKMVRRLISIPIFPIIRPRSGDFYYSEIEFDAMKQDVLLCKELGFNGVVIGILNQDGNIDTKKTSTLVQLAYPLEVTFHRAFDRCKNPIEGLEQVINCGCQRILTSGQYPIAIQGVKLISQLVEKANDRIVIMPGGGVRSNNISELAQKTGAVEFHSSAGIIQNTQMNFIVGSMDEDLNFVDVDMNEIKCMQALLASISKAN